MSVQHASLTATADVHEPKGLPALNGGAADSGHVYVSTGAGAGEWRTIPHSALSYSNIGTGKQIITPTSYTVINPTTTGDSDPNSFTTNNLGRLTYSGTHTLDINFMATITAKHNAASVNDCYFAFHKNGTTLIGIEQVEGLSNGQYRNICIQAHASITVGDYVELFCKVASGDIYVHSMAMTALGIF